MLSFLQRAIAVHLARTRTDKTLWNRSFLYITQACQFYVSQFWLLPMSFDVFLPPPSINPSQIPAVLKLLSAATGVEAVFKSNCFEFHGTEGEVRRAVQLALDLDIVKAFHHEIRFQIELANEHREFISGKKNGKLNKIMKAAGVKIKFETFNDYNFLIDTAGNDTGALHGLSLLQEELPAEISFHVPEIYHKRIIGVGGKNIQRIMKKFGVYVKFSNAEELASLGGYLDNEDNVVARTPAKNSQSLEQLKQAVMEMVIPKDKDFVVESVSIPRRYHRTLLGEKSIFIHGEYESAFVEPGGKTKQGLQLTDTGGACAHVPLTCFNFSQTSKTRQIQKSVSPTRKRPPTLSASTGRRAKCTSPHRCSSTMSRSRQSTGCRTVKKCPNWHCRQTFWNSKTASRET